MAAVSITHGGEPRQRAGNQLLQRGRAPIGRHRLFEPPPQFLERHQLRGAEREKRQGDPRRRGCITHPVWVVGWGVVPDQQLRHPRPDLAEFHHRRHDVLRAAAQQRQADHLARHHIQCPEERPPGVTTTDHDVARLAHPAPPCPQGRKLAQRRLISHPHLATNRQHGLCGLAHGPLVSWMLWGIPIVTRQIRAPLVRGDRKKALVAASRHPRARTVARAS